MEEVQVYIGKETVLKSSSAIIYGITFMHASWRIVDSQLFRLFMTIIGSHTGLNLIFLRTATLDMWYSYAITLVQKGTMHNIRISRGKNSQFFIQDLFFLLAQICQSQLLGPFRQRSEKNTSNALPKRPWQTPFLKKKIDIKITNFKICWYVSYTSWKSIISLKYSENGTQSCLVDSSLDW